LLSEDDAPIGTVPIIAIDVGGVVDIIVIISITLCMVDLAMVSHELVYCRNCDRVFVSRYEGSFSQLLREEYLLVSDFFNSRIALLDSSSSFVS